MNKFNLKTFQGLILTLGDFWINKGFTLSQSSDLQIGAGTSHQLTFFVSIGKNPIYTSYVQPVRRPTDGRYGINTNRLQQYYQFQVIMKPSLNNMQDLYIESLEKIGLNLNKNDIRFIEDDWENPTLGAWGLGWEVWLNGMEITQFTYFQQMGGLECKPITGEITYGLERLAMYLQDVDNVNDLLWGKSLNGDILYKNIFLKNEFEQSCYNFKYSNISNIINCFNKYKKESKRLLKLNVPLIIPSYEFLLKAIHNFNLLEARRAISITERQNYIIKIRNIAKSIAKIYFDSN